MSFLRTSLLSLTLTGALTGLSVMSLAERVPTVLSGNVVTCGQSARCTNEVMFGRIYKVIETAKFTVMVSISNEGTYVRADVSIANHGNYPQNVSPQDFQVEVVSPKARMLKYVPPQGLQRVAPPSPAPVARSVVAAPAIMAKGSGAAPSVDELFAQAKKEEAAKEAAAFAVDRAAAQRDLVAAPIPANGVVRGRVYFQKDPKARRVNVVLPVAGLVFEFPYSMTF